MSKQDAVPERDNAAQQPDFEVEVSDISSANTADHQPPAQPARITRLSPRARTRRVIIAACALLLAVVVMVGSISSIRDRVLALVTGPTPTATFPPTATLMPPPVTPTPVLPSQPLGAVPQNCQPGMAPQVFDPRDFRPGIGGGPVWVTGFEGPRATLSVDPSPQNYTAYGWGATIIVALDTAQPITATLQGVSVSTGFPLWLNFSFLFSETTIGMDFSSGNPSQHSDGHWASWIGYLYIPAAGCYQLKATWPGGQWQVNFAAGRAGA
jgi:hypothetical protein